MTFAQWFEKNYAAPPGVPADVAEVLRQAAHAAYADCWNTAIEEAAGAVSTSPAANLIRLRKAPVPE